MGGELYLSASSEPGHFHKPEPKSLRNQCRPMEVDAAPLKEVEGTSSACERVFTLGSGSGALPSAHIELWRKGQLCDMELTAGGQSFSAHRYVMAGASAYVRTRLAAHMGDSKSCIEVADQPPEVLSALLNFIYTGTCCVGESQLCSLLHAASFFQVDALQGVCEKELTEKELTDENVLEAWLVADSLTLPTLDAAAQAKASANFEKLSATPAFARLRPHMLTALVQSESLQLTSEENVHHAILAWGAAQAPPASVETLLSMLQHVRYPHCCCCCGPGEYARPRGVLLERPRGVAGAPLELPSAVGLCGPPPPPSPYGLDARPPRAEVWPYLRSRAACKLATEALRRSKLVSVPGRRALLNGELPRALPREPEPRPRSW